jgi:hypothetical protein
MQGASMTAKSPKRPRDPNQLAKLITDIATGNTPAPDATITQVRASKAGTVGGPARARSLTPEQRAQIASVAAQARWKKD